LLAAHSDPAGDVFRMQKRLVDSRFPVEVAHNPRKIWPLKRDVRLVGRVFSNNQKIWVTLTQGVLERLKFFRQSQFHVITPQTT
jgi:hypothetical protein